MNLGERVRLQPHLGRYIDEMPALIAAGETPISTALALELQLKHLAGWGRTCVFTGDAALTGVEGDIVIDKNSSLLYAANEKSRLSNHALVLSAEQWEERRHNKDTFYLSAEEVREASGKGYVKVRGVWQPENRVVGYVWDILINGKDPREYAELAFQKSPDAERVLDLYFDGGEQSNRLNPQIIGRPLVVVYRYGRVFADSDYLDKGEGLLVGVETIEALDDLVTINNDE